MTGLACACPPCWAQGILAAPAWGLFWQAIAKAGVGCAGDAQKLMRDFGLAMAGCVDLSEQANLRMCGPGSQRVPQTWSLCRAPSLPHLSWLYCRTQTA